MKEPPIAHRRGEPPRRAAYSQGDGYVSTRAVSGQINHRRGHVPEMGAGALGERDGRLTRGEDLDEVGRAPDRFRRPRAIVPAWFDPPVRREPVRLEHVEMAHLVSGEYE